MSLLRPIWQDLRSKRLWPLAAALLVAIVAVPVVLSSSSSSSPVTPPPAAAAPVVNGLPAVSDSAAPATAAPTGSARSPFAPVGGTATGAPTTVTATLPGTTTAPTAPSTPSGASGPVTPPTTTPAGGTTTGQPTIPTPKPKPSIPTLTPEESYSVSLAITKPTGGLDTIHPLERLTPLPSAQQPLLVELGVLKGGSRVLFAVQPGTVVSGKGTCIPGAIDCEILSLAQGQTEHLSLRTSRGVVRVAAFAVTGITAVKHPSRSAAMKVRNRVSAAGRRVLGHSSMKALKLFRYESGAGAVIDLRNLILRNS